MSRRTLAAFATALMLSLQGGAAHSTASSIVDLPDTPLSSPNVHLLGTIPTGVGVGGHFMGRYFFQTTAKTGNYLPGAPSTGGLFVFDAGNPEQPKLVASLPLPHWENEDVDLSPERKILLITAERTRTGPCEGNIGAAGGDPASCPKVPPMLFVIDISNPTLPSLRATLEMPAYIGKLKKGGLKRGPGHIAACILRCRYAYVTGSRNGGVHVIDLRNLDAPKVLGEITGTPAGLPNKAYPEIGTVHDVTVDPRGNVWLTGSGGTAMYAPVTDPLKPRLQSFVKAVDDKYNALIHHGSLRLDATTVMVNEESYAGQCGWKRNEVDEALRDDEQQGSFQTWQISGSRLKPLGMWKSEAADYTSGGGVAPFCSAHWFSVNRDKVVAIAWYDQGLRLLDVSNPRRIRQIGYWMGPNGSASAAYFVPWRPDIVYVADYNRGLDVVKVDNAGRGAPTLVAPMRAQWFANYRGIRYTPAMRPDPDFGYACLRPASIDW